MSNYLYVDASNLVIEGTRVSAVARGRARSIREAQEARVVDSSWRLDFWRLIEIAGGSRASLAQALLFGSRPPSNGPLAEPAAAEAYWAAAERAGFTVRTTPRNERNREKKVDASLSMALAADSYTRIDQVRDEVTLAAGDADYVPVVENLTGRGIRVYVLFWEHASRELKAAATVFKALNPFFAVLTLGSTRRSSVAPTSALASRGRDAGLRTSLGEVARFTGSLTGGNSTTQHTARNDNGTPTKKLTKAG